MVPAVKLFAADEFAGHIQPGNGGKGADVKTVVAVRLEVGVLLGDRLGADGAGIEQAARWSQRAGAAGTPVPAKDEPQAGKLVAEEPWIAIASELTSRSMGWPRSCRD